MRKTFKTVFLIALSLCVFFQSFSSFTMALEEQPTLSNDVEYFNDDLNNGTDFTESVTERGWQLLNGEWFYFDLDTGIMLTGWQDNIPGWEGKKFYFDPVTGIMQIGWTNKIVGLEGKWFYFDTDTGVMLTGWQNKIPNYFGDWFYFDLDTGIMLTGWQDNIPGWEKQKFYFDPITGVMQISWANQIVGLEGSWFYFDIDTGVMLTGWQNKIPNYVGDWFYFDLDTGIMLTGWQDNIPGWEKQKFYFDPITGIMQTGYVHVDGNCYLFDNDGVFIEALQQVECRGIDVSTWQGDDIDWNAIKASGIEFVMIRSNFGWMGKDNRFHQNIQGAKAAGLKVGVYLYSYARNIDEAILEYQNLMDTIAGYSLDYPVAYDIEDVQAQGRLSVNELTDIVVTFCEKVKSAGYKPMVYASTSWMENKLDYSRIQGYNLWVAQYYSECQYSYPYQMWQYSSKGAVEGIDGNVDLSFCYGLK